MLTQLTGFALTRGMLCAMKRPKLPSVEELCQASSRLVILENIMNPTNIGAIFRSAAALGMDGVLLTSDCSTRFTGARSVSAWEPFSRFRGPSWTAAGRFRGFPN